MAQDMVNRLAVLAAMACLTLAQGSRAEQGRVVNEDFFSDDSDHARQQAYYLGYQAHPGWVDAKDSAGVWAGRWNFDDVTGSEHFDVYRLTYVSSVAQHSKIDLRASYLDGERWSPWTGGATFATTPNERWHFEGSLERDIIDSVPGIRLRLRNDGASASADYNFNPQWTVVGALLHQSVSDGNDRNGGVLRIIYSVPQWNGFNVQTRSKYIRSDFDGDGYFSPPVLEEHLLLFGVSRSFAGDRWVGSALVGPGVQRFEDSGDTTRNDAFFSELKLKGWFTDRFGLEGHGVCTNTGGPASGAPGHGYRYCSALLSLIGSW